MPATKAKPIILKGTPSRNPELVSFSGMHQHAALLRAKAKPNFVAEAAAAPRLVVAPLAAAAAAPAADPAPAATAPAAAAPAAAAPAAAAPAAAAAAPDTTTIPGVALATTVQGFVAGLAVTAFAAGLSVDARAAALNAITYCTLAANGDIKRNPALTYIDQWASYLPTCAFAQTSSGSGGYTGTHQNVGIDQALLDCVAQMSTDIASIDILKDVISALKTLPNNQDTLTLFSHDTIRNGQVTVATSMVTQPANSPVQLTVTFMQFSFASTETRVLWITVDTTTSAMSYTTVTAQLQDNLAPVVEPLLTSKLSSLYAANIAAIDLT